MRSVRVVTRLEALTGAAGVVGGLLLIVEPDGRLLDAKRSALSGSPFSDWRVPGLLLLVLVGGGLLATALWQARQGPYARVLSIAAGVGLVCFEGAELAWIGFQPLEAVFAVVGLLIAGLALAQEGTKARPITPTT